jgi:metallo-beta-lactamase family protein
VVIIISKKSDKAVIKVIGGNAEAVTGSCTMIEYKGETYLFECGMYQGKTTEISYKENKRILSQIKPQKIDVVIIGHNHSDHTLNIPALYSTGKCNARIIVPKGSTAILKEMWLDGAYINDRDSKLLSAKAEKYIPPLFTEADVHVALKHIEEYESHKVHQITELLSIKYTPAGHIFLSQQTEVILKDTVNKTIMFTSDIGNLTTQNERVFVEPFEPVKKANVVICECTYSAKGRSTTRKDYELDVQKIKTVVQQYCVDSRNRVICPTFSLDRLPFMMWIVYSLFKDDENFNVPVIIDSPLAIRLLHCYSDLLEGDAKQKFDEMVHWDNFEFIYHPEDSKDAVADRRAKLVLCSSGMLTAGRSVKWVQNALPNENDCILFTGYSTEGSLAWKIKNGNTQKTININGKPYKNKANIVSLHSFSGHMSRTDMLDYYSSIVADKIYLVHSDQNKVEFKDDLQDLIHEKLKTTKVVAVNRSTKIVL